MRQPTGELEFSIYHVISFSVMLQLELHQAPGQRFELLSSTTRKDMLFDVELGELRHCHTSLWLQHSCPAVGLAENLFALFRVNRLPEVCRLHIHSVEAFAQRTAQRFWVVALKLLRHCGVQVVSALPNLRQQSKASPQLWIRESSCDCVRGGVYSRQRTWESPTKNMGIANHRFSSRRDPSTGAFSHLLNVAF